MKPSAAVFFAIALLAWAPQARAQAPSEERSQTPLSVASGECKTKNISAVPLAVYLTPQGVFPAAPDQFGTAAHACVGSAPVAPSTQPFSAGYPYPGAWWTTGAYPYPLPLYHGT